MLSYLLGSLLRCVGGCRALLQRHFHSFRDLIPPLLQTCRNQIQHYHSTALRSPWLRAAIHTGLAGTAGIAEKDVGRYDHERGPSTDGTAFVKHLRRFDSSDDQRQVLYGPTALHGKGPLLQDKPELTVDELVSSIIQLSRPWEIHGAWAQAGSAYIWMANVLSTVSVPKQSLMILREEEYEQKNATRGITLLIYRFPPPCHATHGATST